MNTGDRLGDYEIVNRLGEGGMGEVYKVRNIHSKRLEAIKVLRSSVSGADLLSRFEREIRVQASLDHPNIVRLHTALLIDGQLVMVMELVEGVLLERVLVESPPGIEQSIDFACDILQGLDYAHSKGVVHRDIKPANAIKTSTGIVKLLDFGIAHLRAEQRLTRDGFVVGSPHYMSPEQIRGLEPDPRSDVYSLGIVLYQMVVGKRPFVAESEFALLVAHCEQMPTPPHEIAASVPSSLSRIILKAIAKDPALRFQTAREFCESLAGCRPNQNVLRPLATRRLTITAVGGVVIAFASVLAIEGWRRSPAKANFEVAPEPIGNPPVGPETKALETAAPWPRGAPPQPKSARAEVQSARPKAAPNASSPSPIPPALQSRLIDVGTRVAAVRSRLELFSEQLRSQGLSLNQVLVVANDRASRFLSLAESAAAAGRYSDAMTNLDDAEEQLRAIADRLGSQQ